MKKGKVLNLFESNNASQNTEEKYATLLEKFILPFSNDLTSEVNLNNSFQDEIFIEEKRTKPKVCQM